MIRQCSNFQDYFTSFTFFVGLFEIFFNSGQNLLCRIDKNCEEKDEFFLFKKIIFLSFSKPGTWSKTNGVYFSAIIAAAKIFQ